MRAWIYDRLFYNISKDWYRKILESLPQGARMLDVGVGTGSSLLANVDLLEERALRVEGIDINTSYLKSCQEKIDEIGVGHQIKVRQQSVYDLDPKDRYDAIYFSASFMLLPNQEEALKVVQQSLTETGRVCFTQTFETKRTRFWEIVKPLLVFFTTVHFGVVTYEDSFISLLEDAGLEVESNSLLRHQGPRVMRAIIAKPR